MASIPYFLPICGDGGKYRNEIVYRPYLPLLIICGFYHKVHAISPLWCVVSRCIYARYIHVEEAESDRSWC